MTILRPTRRDILKLSAMAPALALPALPARAMLGRPAAANPGHFSFTIGEAKLTVISDGYFSAPMNTVGVNADPAEVLAFMAQYFLPTDADYRHTNHLLIETGGATVLIDVGSGSRFLPTTGRLMANMEAAGIDPASITHVVITHAHPDHIWGIRDDFDEPLVAGAEYVVGEAERGWWLQDGLVNRVAPEMQQFVVGAANSLTVEGVEWTLADDGHEVVPGIRMIPTFGHTAGHMAVIVESEGQQLLALGDAITHAYMHFAHPDWYITNDLDPAQTVATRTRLLDMAAADRMAVVGYHFPFPGVGHVVREDAAYRFVPALWQF